MFMDVTDYKLYNIKVKEQRTNKKDTKNFF